MSLAEQLANVKRCVCKRCLTDVIREALDEAARVAIQVENRAFRRGEMTASVVAEEIAAAIKGLK
jgi:hypothetical protein